MCLTVHFIGEDWRLKKWVLKFKVLNWESLAGAAWKCLEHWGIRDRVLTLALNSYSFNGETVELVKDYIHEKNPLLLGGKLFHVHCCAELLTSMAQSAVKDISDIIEEKLKELFPWGKSEPVWNVTDSNLKMALELKSMGEFTSDDLDPSYLLSAEEWERVEGVSKLVDKLHAVAEVLFHAKHPSAFLYLSNLHLLHGRLMEQDSTSTCTFVSAIREKMLQKLGKYWESMFPLLAVAVVMDPRCKMAYIEYLSSMVLSSYGNGNTQSSEVSVIVQSLYETYPVTTQLEDSADKDFSSEEDEEDYSGSDLEREIDAGTEKGNSDCVSVEMESHLQDYQQYVLASKQPARSELAQSELAQSELGLYLEEPVVAWDQEFKLLQWWKMQKAKFPTLSRMARDLLSIPFSVVTSYDAYYIEDRFVDKHLLSSSQVLMDALKCTRSWNQKP